MPLMMIEADARVLWKYEYSYNAVWSDDHGLLSNSLTWNTMSAHDIDQWSENRDGETSPI